MEVIVLSYCPNCGEEVSVDDRFCSECGAEIVEERRETPESSRGTKTSLELDENIEGLLCYLVLWVSGIIFYVIEEENKFVRFHAMQSIVTFLPLMVLGWIFRALAGAFWWAIGGGLIFGALSWLVGIATFVLWIILMIKAYQGKRYKLPIAGDIAEEHI